LKLLSLNSIAGFRTSTAYQAPARSIPSTVSTEPHAACPRPRITPAAGFPVATRLVPRAATPRTVSRTTSMKPDRLPSNPQFSLRSRSKSLDTSECGRPPRLRHTVGERMLCSRASLHDARRRPSNDVFRPHAARRFPHTSHHELAAGTSAERGMIGLLCTRRPHAGRLRKVPCRTHPHPTSHEAYAGRTTSGFEIRHVGYATHGIFIRTSSQAHEAPGRRM
jgi:hypothetical protein